jgi:DNA-binding CsgD family transcriptional regulator
MPNKNRRRAAADGTARHAVQARRSSALCCPADIQTRWLSGRQGQDAHRLASLYETAGRPDGWSAFLDVLVSSYEGGKAIGAIHDTARHNGSAFATSGWEPARISAYPSRYSLTNPFIPPMAKRPVGLVVLAGSAVPRSELIKTEFYNDMLRPSNIDDVVTVILQRDGSLHMTLAVGIPQVTAEGDADAIGRLQRLAPHLIRVVQLNRRLADLEMQANAAEAALDRFASAMLIVNTVGHVIFMNRMAERIVAAGDGLRLVGKGLDAASRHESLTLRNLVASALLASHRIEAEPGGVMRVTRPSGHAPYEVLVVPISGTTMKIAFNGPLAAIFVRDPVAQVVTSAKRLQGLYGLTGAEARLMQALLAGETLNLIAERTRVSKETLRSQLKAVFQKSGTSSQAELIRLGIRGLATIEGAIRRDW